MHFLTYLPPPLSHDDPASWEEWLERGSFLEKDLRKLLCLPHDKFWCQVSVNACQRQVKGDILCDIMKCETDEATPN